MTVFEENKTPSNKDMAKQIEVKELFDPLTLEYIDKVKDALKQVEYASKAATKAHEELKEAVKDFESLDFSK